MIIRSAYLVGTVDESNRIAFDTHMSGPVLQAISTYPSIRNVRLRRLVRGEEGAPNLLMVFDLYFDSLESMDEALASPTRQAVRSIIAQGMSMFNGRVFHQVFIEDKAL
ncbi:hypothetical protein [Limnohabitans sp.]|uniref:hypothetical protein n=1 Tax=Limnohabitans sp. TaxID=1907725 RepID=UPI00286F8595|nr:hypothetical protein [Limnohabitans sp.]